VQTLLPFSRDQFFEIFGAYNVAVWPAPIVAVGLAVVTLGLIVLRERVSCRATFAVLALLWAWTGAVYHILFFATINRAAVLFGIFFLLQAVLFLASAWNGKIALSRQAPSQWLGLAFITYALVLYPMFVRAIGHAYPAAPSFGVTPCPLVIYTFGVLLLTPKRAPWPLFAIPILWAAVGAAAALLLGIYPDYVLPLSALAAVIANARKTPEAEGR
jgi:hypothetical protein